MLLNASRKVVGELLELAMLAARLDLPNEAWTDLDAADVLRI